MGGGEVGGRKMQKISGTVISRRERSWPGGGGGWGLCTYTSWEASILQPCVQQQERGGGCGGEGAGRGPASWQRDRSRTTMEKGRMPKTGCRP